MWATTNSDTTVKLSSSSSRSSLPPSGPVTMPLASSVDETDRCEAVCVEGGNCGRGWGGSFNCLMLPLASKRDDTRAGLASALTAFAGWAFLLRACELGESSLSSSDGIAEGSSSDMTSSGDDDVGEISRTSSSISEVA